MDKFEHLYHTLSGFMNLTSADKKLIRILFKEVTFKKGTLFLKQGKICDHLGFICKGIFRYYIDRDGEDKTYNFATEGDFLCNYESLIQCAPSAKHIEAIELSEVLVISKKDLQRFYSEVRDGNLFGRLHMENVYAVTIRQLISQYTESAEERYLKFLRMHPTLTQRIPQYYIASFIGVKPQSLSRIRKRLARRLIS
jgi:CRP-like cAMP-binding protein